MRVVEGESKMEKINFFEKGLVDFDDKNICYEYQQDQFIRTFQMFFRCYLRGSPN